MLILARTPSQVRTGDCPRRLRRATNAFMNIQYLCTRWGSDGLPAAEFISQVRDAGYDGVEVGLADDDPAADEVLRLAAAEGMTIVTMHYLTQHADTAVHCREFAARLRRAASFRPAFINSHTGRDFFNLRRNLEVLDAAAEVAEETGVPIYHETHRGRCLQAPWRAAEVLAERPATGLVLDVSHWCTVCESLLEDQEDALASFFPAVRHIHARVGHAQGPQVSDPRAPEWQPALQAHLRWWDLVVSVRRAAGAKTLTITPEFGPPPYLHALPWTQQPVGSQWELNLHMMQLLRSRYA